MTLPNFDREEASEKRLISQLSVDQYFQWVQRQPAADRGLSELIEGKIYSLPKDIAQTRMLRLLQWQLQHFLRVESAEGLETTTAEENRLKAYVRLPVQLSNFSYMKPAILVRKSSAGQVEREEDWLDTNTVWIIDLTEDSVDEIRIRLYAQAGVSNYWLLKHSSAELHLYQQPSASGYQSRRVLQVGDRASPNSVPITIQLQEPVPLYFMTRTLRGQQTYKSSALPFAFSRS